MESRTLMLCQMLWSLQKKKSTLLAGGKFEFLTTLSLHLSGAGCLLVVIEISVKSVQALFYTQP